MRRGTTPTVTLTITNPDNTDCDLTGYELYITFQEKTVNKKDTPYSFTKRETDEGVEILHEDLATVINITLTQQETLGFSTDSIVQVQLRCKTLNIAQATTIKDFKVEEILLDGEI